MRKIIFFICLFSFIFSTGLALAQTNLSNIAIDDYAATGENEGRFTLLMMKGRSTQNTSIPGLILDSFQGIVWVCEDLENARPIWLKTDLARNKDALSHKRYVARILEWQEGNFKVPAIIIDTEEGNIWTCANVAGDGDTWTQTDFKNATQQEIRGTQIKY
ncbi:MAG: hypothetical protein PHC54_04550 [Candidatus Omnitrophica bacterium]|nr:hypothetical protein [Candidatus Omnitrophota bacterium]MDD5593054.1 hypothetical protein [Candidatus Omnitrophota bacterium]